MNVLATLVLRYCGIALIASVASSSALGQFMSNGNYVPERDGSLKDLVSTANYFGDENGKPYILEHDRKGKRSIYSPIAVVTTDKEILIGNRKSRGSGNAFLVSPCYALTNQHVVFGTANPIEIGKEKVKTYTVTMTLVDENDSMTKKIKATPVDFGAFNFDSETPNRMNDWALLKLDDCWGRKIGWVEPWSTGDAVPFGLPAHGSFYPNGIPSDTMTTAIPCKLLYEHDGHEGTVWINNCSARPGSSGSPIFLITGGIPKAVAIQSASFGEQSAVIPYSDERGNIAIDMSLIYFAVQIHVLPDLATYRSKYARDYLRQRGAEMPEDYNPAYDLEGPLKVK